jgi:hypothetical protein
MRAVNASGVSCCRHQFEKTELKSGMQGLADNGVPAVEPKNSNLFGRNDIDGCVKSYSWKALCSFTPIPYLGV